MSNTADLDRIKPLDDLEGVDAPEIIDELAQIVRRQLELLGEDPERQGLIKTPDRVALSLAWLTRGYEQDVRKVIGDAVGESSDDVKADLGTMTLFDLSKGKEVMGTSSSHGKIYDNVKAAAEFWKGQGKVDNVVSPNDAVDPSFINSL